MRKLLRLLRSYKGYRQFWGALSDIASALEGTSGRSSYHGMRVVDGNF